MRDFREGVKLTEGNEDNKGEAIGLRRTLFAAFLSVQLLLFFRRGQRGFGRFEFLADGARLFAGVLLGDQDVN